MYVFQKILLLFSAVLLTCSTEGLHLFLKLPAAIEHYQHHLEEHDHQEHFIHFLAEHLALQHEHHNEHGEDHESPFHHEHQGICAASLMAVPVIEVSLGPINLKIDTKDVSSYSPQFHPSDFSAAIWQPPQYS
jgi:hypothetical protein